MEDLEVVRLLGQGGIATVYLCRRRQTGELLAVKRIPQERLKTAEQKRRAAAERHLLKHLSGPYLAKGIRSYEDDDFLSMEMEYIVDARPLYQCIWQYRQTGRLSESVAKYFAAQIVLAVASIHDAGYMHRDLKSGNVVIDHRGIAFVIDYGFAKALKSGGSTECGGRESQRTWSLCGTHYVMAPEMFRRQVYGTEVDWWGLGVIIHEMVTGRPPWEYKPSADLPVERFFDEVIAGAERLALPKGLTQTDMSPQCRSLIQSLLEVEPEKRLGHNGASEVMAHGWFHDIDWKEFSAQGHVQSPYDSKIDFNPSLDLLHRRQDETVDDNSPSSAESIDPEDDAKYFGDF
ncbi:hypothetical protein Poli38472_000761 [Pythium oligandrum]|uniref:Protein kinase domain-containing protein n=1 Tax=Pythium oligandrum TaxID=41045 RepID=A0A8K1FH68_PYTOL|nr:hypothetical protein Poli38472_000761 [Pythium oligandrum]|eukprot:TMW60719.1 hypothetical protein Poli38472_000761 [Pythium oligandrum]